MWVSITSLINFGAFFYFLGLLKNKINKIIELLKLRYPEKVKELVGNNDESVDKNQKRYARIKLARFIRNNDLVQDIEYGNLRKEFLSSSKKFQLALPGIFLIESLIFLVPILLIKQSHPTNQAIAREVPLVVFYGSFSLIWFVYQLYRWNKSPNSNLMPVGKIDGVEADNKNVIKFEIAKFSKNFYKNYNKCGLIVVILFFLLLSTFTVYQRLKFHMSFINDIEGIAIFCGVLYLLVLGGVYRSWQSRFLYELSIDMERKEFRGIIGDRQKEIIFKGSDIKKIEESPNSQDFRFYLNDGTWVTWSSAGTDKDRLEQILKSLGLDISVKAFW